MVSTHIAKFRHSGSARKCSLHKCFNPTGRALSELTESNNNLTCSASANLMQPHDWIQTSISSKYTLGKSESISDKPSKC